VDMWIFLNKQEARGL